MSTIPTIQTIDDLLLGLYGALLPPSKNVDQAVRLFSTWSGSDKLLMVTQYTAKLLIPFFQKRAELQFHAGKRLDSVSPAKAALAKFAGQISTTRRVSGFWCLLHILKSMPALERARPADRLTLNLRRIQGISMLLFYPLDYIAFFSAQPSPLLRGLTPAQSARAGLWSVRAWGVYVAAQAIVLARELAGLCAESVPAKTDDETRAVDRRKRDIVLGLVANVTRLPVILHWSLVHGLYNNEIWTDILSLISGLAALQAGWESHALSR